jgi:hypothetical protein
MYTTLKFLALQGATYIYDISRLRVKHRLAVPLNPTNVHIDCCDQDSDRGKREGYREQSGGWGLVGWVVGGWDTLTGGVWGCDTVSVYFCIYFCIFESS